MNARVHESIVCAMESTMAKKITRKVIKNTDHLNGLPCITCHFMIWPDELYMETTLSSEKKTAECERCNPSVAERSRR